MGGWDGWHTNRQRILRSTILHSTPPPSTMVHPPISHWWCSYPVVLHALEVPEAPGDGQRHDEHGGEEDVDARHHQHLVRGGRRGGGVLSVCGWRGEGRGGGVKGRRRGMGCSRHHPPTTPLSPSPPPSVFLFPPHHLVHEPLHGVRPVRRRPPAHEPCVSPSTSTTKTRGVFERSFHSFMPSYGSIPSIQVFFVIHVSTISHHMHLPTCGPPRELVDDGGPRQEGEEAEAGGADGVPVDDLCVCFYCICV